LKLSIENRGQIAADGDMVLLTAYKKSPALSDNTIADLLWLTV